MGMGIHTTRRHLHRKLAALVILLTLKWSNYLVCLKIILFLRFVNALCIIQALPLLNVFVKGISCAAIIVVI